jgi:hypothetical protein
MYDPREMFPRGYHPQVLEKTRDFKGKARYYTRTQRPPKYYFIDFGLSKKYDPADVAPLEDPIFGGDKSVPEFQGSSTPCNPFPVDIYCAGNFIRRDFLDVCSLFVHSMNVI